MIFYGVYIENKKISATFDMIRFLSQPDALRRTHITVRGPYKRRIDIQKLNQTKIGDLCIQQPGHFFFEGQQTVFLKCEIVGVRDIWNKPNFQNVVPHLTIYDGPDPDFSTKIHSILKSFPWNMWLRITPLAELEKKVVSTSSINITERDFVSNFSNIFDYSGDISKVKNLPKYQRVEMIDYLIRARLRQHMNPTV